MIRPVAVGAIAWALVVLLLHDPRIFRPQATPKELYRHLALVLDVSPSMELQDAGGTRTERLPKKEGEEDEAKNVSVDVHGVELEGDVVLSRRLKRKERASELVESILTRIAIDQVRVSVVAVFTGAKRVVVDTSDLNVIRNILNDLPMEYAFDYGKTRLIDGIREACDLAKPWRKKSTTLLVVTDGDTVPDEGMPQPPPSIAASLIVGVGDTGAGIFIDGHQSRQDAATLRSIAGRLRGVYYDGNTKHLPSEVLAGLSRSLPFEEKRSAGRREAALFALALGALLLALLPVALEFAGSRWKVVNRSVAERTTP